MRLFAVLIVCVFVLSNCATLLNSDDQEIRITSHPRISNIRVDSCNFPQTYAEFLEVKRSKKPLIIHCRLDSVNKTIAIRAGHAKIWYLNLNPYAGYGIGFIFDRKTQRKYAYPSHIYLDVKDSTVKWKPFKPIKKGSFFVDISVPYVNFFTSKTLTGDYAIGGFMGLQMGTEFYHNTNKFLSLNIGAAFDFPVPVPAPYDHFGPVQGSKINFMTLRNNLVNGKFELGYGLNYSKSIWHKTDTSGNYFKKVSYTTGLSFSAFWRGGKTFRMGFIYNPSFVLLNPTPRFYYGQLISYVISWKIPVWQAK